MTCKNCGHELPETAKFCNQCGTPVEAAPEAEKELDAEAVETEVPAAAPVNEEPEAAPARTAVAVEERPVPEEAPAPAPVKEKKKLPMKLIGIAAAAVVIFAAVIFGAVKLIPVIFGGGDSFYLYATDDNELMFLKNLKEKTEAAEVSDEVSYNSRVIFSKDGTYLYFFEHDAEKDGAFGDLYRVKIADLSKKEFEADKISSGVYLYSVYTLDDGGLIYFKGNDGEDLYQMRWFDGEESHKLINDVRAYVTLSEDQKSVYCEGGKYGQPRTLYKVGISADGEKETLIKDYDELYSLRNSEVLVYGEYNDDYDVTVKSLNVKDGTKDTLIKDVYSVFDFDQTEDSVSFAYTLENTKEYTLYDFVTDKTLETDEKMTEPVYPEYPDYWDYYVYEVYQDENGVWLYETWNDDVYEVNFTPEQYEMAGYLPADFEAAEYSWERETIINEVLNFDYEAAIEEYDAAYEDYERAYDEWWAADDRNYIRENLKDWDYTLYTYTLNRYVDGETTEIADGLSDGYPDHSGNGIYLYKKIEFSGNKVMDVSEIEYYDEVYYKVTEGENAVYCQNINGAESRFELEDNAEIEECYILSDTEAIFVLNKNGKVSLNSFVVENNALEFVDALAEDGFTDPYIEYEENGDAYLYYFVDVNDEETCGDLYCYKEGKAERVASEVYSYITTVDGDNYAFTDVENDKKTYEYVGVLSKIEKGKLVEVVDDVTTYDLVFIDGKSFLYMSDGDLHLWDGKESRRIARDVTRIWAPEAVKYTTYQIEYVYFDEDMSSAGSSDWGGTNTGADEPGLDF